MIYQNGFAALTQRLILVVSLRFLLSKAPFDLQRSFSRICVIDLANAQAHLTKVPGWTIEPGYEAILNLSLLAKSDFLSLVLALV